MKPDDVLKYPTTVLTEAQRAAYFDNGYLTLPDYVPSFWLDRLRRAMAETVESSRSVTRSDAVFTLEEGHSATSRGCTGSAPRKTSTRCSGSSSATP